LVLVFGGAAGFYLARPSGGRAFGPLLINTLFFFLAFLWIHLGNVRDDWMAIATNLLLVITGIWLIRRGIDEAITHYFYTGVGVLLLTALFRYFDLIGDYIGGAILFIIAAIILFGAARYWRSRTLKKEVADV
jgi:protein-S-isoprenylcysteine O-methyltransferase Ste14